MEWFENELEKHYEITRRGRLGPGDHDLKEATLLNRVITWSESGIELEADPRQAERLVRQLSVEGANTLSTPGVKVQVRDIIVDDPLDDKRSAIFKAAVARANYMARDRLECQSATKE